MSKVKELINNNLAAIIVLLSVLLCALFVICGTRNEDGSITIDGSSPEIKDYTVELKENFEESLNRIMNEDAPTDEETIRKWAVIESEGQGAYTTLEQVLARRLSDGDNDGGRGWQCSKYTAYLATGQREYSSSHPDYGPVNGKDVAAYLVRTRGWKYIDTPVLGAIGSGGFNTLYGHTVMFLEWVGTNVALVNDANFTPLRVATHSMNISGYVWVVPGDYTPTPTPTPEPTPAPTPTPEPVSSDSHTVVQGDTLGGISIYRGWYNGVGPLFGDNGYTQKLAEKNGIQNRGLIFPGQVIFRY